MAQRRAALAGLLLAGCLCIGLAAPAQTPVTALKLPAMPANYPYPQCWTTTQSYDIDFVGPLKFQQIGQVKYGYHRFGPLVEKASTKSPVVFVPGFGTVMYIWPIPLIQRLAYDREVIMFDYPGVGASRNISGRPADLDYSVEGLAGSVMQFVRSLKLAKKPDILGWSLGGMVAYAMAANYGAELENILAYSSSSGGQYSFAPPQGTWENFLRVRSSDNPEFVKYFFPKGAKDAGVCSLYASWNSFYRSRYTRVDRLTLKGEPVLVRQAVAMANFYRTQVTWEKLRTVTNRVMMLHGVEDVLVPVKNAAVAARRVVGSWMVTIPNAGHGVIFQNVQAAIFTSLEFFGQSTGRFGTDQLEWYNYGRNIPENSPLVSASELMKIIGISATAPVPTSKPSTKLPGLARQQPRDALPALARARPVATEEVALARTRDANATAGVADASTPVPESPLPEAAAAAATVATPAAANSVPVPLPMKAVVVEGNGGTTSGVTVITGDTTKVTVAAGPSNALPKAASPAPVPAQQQIVIGRGKFPLLDHIAAKLAMLG